MSSTDPPRGSIASGTQHEAVLSRAALRSSKCRLFRKGPSHKADLLLVETGGERWVVKDFARKPRWARLVGRLMIARESRAYRALGALPGLPRFVGRIDAHALAIDYVAAVPLAFAPERTRDGERKLRELRSIVDRLHAAGVVHCDLRGRDNVLLDREGRLCVVDLASAIRLRPGGVLHRALFGLLRQIDHAALLKWKRIVEAGPFTEDEQRLERRFRALRPLWLHRRRAWRGGGSGLPG